MRRTMLPLCYQPVLEESVSCTQLLNEYATCAHILVSAAHKRMEK